MPRFTVERPVELVNNLINSRHMNNLAFGTRNQHSAKSSTTCHPELAR